MLILLYASHQNDLKPNQRCIFEGLLPIHNCIPFNHRMKCLSGRIDWMWACPWKQMVARLCRKEPCISILISFIMSRFLEVILSIQIPTLNIQFISAHKPIEKHLHLFFLTQLSASISWCINLDTQKMHLSRLWLPHSGASGSASCKWGTEGPIPCNGYGIYTFGPDWQLYKRMGRNYIN